MEKCNGCEHEYHGVCMVTEMECDEMGVCTMGTNKAKGHNVGTAKQTEQNKHDNVNHPAHYKDRTSIECIDTMRIAFGDMDVAIYCIVNAYKYLWRHKYKNRLEDLKKAEWYLERYTDLTNDKEWIKLPDEKAETIKELVKKGREEYIHGKRN